MNPLLWKIEYLVVNKKQWNFKSYHGFNFVTFWSDSPSVRCKKLQLSKWEPWWLANIKKIVIQVGCKWIKNLQLLHFRLVSQELPIELITDYGKIWKIQYDDTSGNGDSIKDRWNVDFGKPIVTYIPTNHTTPHELKKTTLVHTTLNMNVLHMQKHDH
jgi:hypothetical protein